MSDIEKLFLAAYPLWPKALLEKFSSLLSIEVAKFNPEINQKILNQYFSLADEKKYVLNQYVKNQIELLTPQDSVHVRKIEFIDYNVWNFNILPINGPGIKDVMFGAPANYSGDVKYDSRLFVVNSVHVAVDYTTVKGPYTMYLAAWSGDVIEVAGIVRAIVSVQMVKYNGARSVLAMIENGVSVDCDHALLKEFVIFLNSYSKYSGELAAANSLQKEKNRQALTDYKNSISEKLLNRKNELSDFRTQMSFAAKNETASAKRDMKNLELSAQSLMFQLKEKLK